MRRLMDSTVPSFQTSLKISLLHLHICVATLQRNKTNSFHDLYKWQILFRDGSSTCDNLKIISLILYIERNSKSK